MALKRLVIIGLKKFLLTFDFSKRTLAKLELVRNLYIFKLSIFFFLNDKIKNYVGNICLKGQRVRRRKIRTYLFKIFG